MSLFHGTKFYSVFNGKCPVCHQGNMYQKRNGYQLSTTLKMHERCSHCNTKFKIEPSFFYGAMYVSYAVGIAFATAVFLISFFIFKLGRFGTFLSIIGALIVLLPIILRLSRNIWINIFFKFDPKKAQ
jgi:uncharacterized protein (DUF983 family)